MIGQILGRWGNFFNAEAFGSETTLPWRMGIRAPGESEAIYVHPTFLYESLWNLVGFILINIFYRKKKYNGQIVLMYITWYGFGRMFIEGLRTDSLYIGDFRISQVIAFLCFFFGLAILTSMEIVCYLRARDEKKALAAESTEVTEAAEEVGSTDNEVVIAEEIITEDDSTKNETDEISSETDEISSETDEITEQTEIERLNDEEEIKELMILDGIQDESETENTEIEQENEESFEEEMFEISDNYSDDDDDEE
jgi:phosphatidylglycerol:prolipoprotein diacylglycerol transferase